MLKQKIQLTIQQTLTNLSIYIGKIFFSLILRLAFEIYEKQLTEAARELIETSCEKLRPVVFGSTNDCVDETMATGTTLFELYLALQQFSKLGHEIFRGMARATEMSNNHTWFNKSVARWLDIALYKAMERITKAVELDDLTPVDEFVKHR